MPGILQPSCGPWEGELRVVRAHRYLSNEAKLLYEIIDHLWPDDRPTLEIPLTELVIAAGRPTGTVRRWRDELVEWEIISINWARGPGGGRSRRNTLMYLTRRRVAEFRPLPPAGSQLRVRGQPDPQRPLPLDDGESPVIQLADSLPTMNVAPHGGATLAPHGGATFTLGKPELPESSAPQGEPGGDSFAEALQRDLDARRAALGIVVEFESAAPVKEVKDLLCASSTSSKNSASCTPDPLVRSAPKDDCATSAGAQGIGEIVPAALEVVAARLDARLTPASVCERIKRDIRADVPELADWACNRLAELVAYGQGDWRLEPREVSGLLAKYRRYRARIAPESRGAYFRAMIEERIKKLGFEWCKTGQCQQRE